MTKDIYGGRIRDISEFSLEEERSWVENAKDILIFLGIIAFVWVAYKLAITDFCPFYYGVECLPK